MVEHSTNDGSRRFNKPVSVHKLSVEAGVSPQILSRVVDQEERKNPEFRISMQSKLIPPESAEMILTLIRAAKADGRILEKVDKSQVD